MTQIDQFISEFKAFYDKKPWYGSSFKKIVDDITPKEALAVPGNGHSIARLLCHMNKWRRFLAIRLQGDTQFQVSDDDLDNWPALNTITVETWENAKSEFGELQQIIVDELSKREDSFLETPFSPRNEKYIYRYLISGVIQHDIYHLGQISLLKQLLRSANPNN
ncbi:MAG: DinB family protein [Bacteroidota bacterium]